VVTYLSGYRKGSVCVSHALCFVSRPGLRLCQVFMSLAFLKSWCLRACALSLQIQVGPLLLIRAKQSTALSHLVLPHSCHVIIHSLTSSLFVQDQH